MDSINYAFFVCFLCLVTVDCGEPQTALTNGAFSSTGTSPGDTATFVCDADFTWSSSTLYTVTCENDGLWFPSIPDGECKRAVLSSPVGTCQLKQVMSEWAMLEANSDDDFNTQYGLSPIFPTNNWHSHHQVQWEMLNRMLFKVRGFGGRSLFVASNGHLFCLIKRSY